MFAKAFFNAVFWACVLIMFLLIGTGTLHYKYSWWSAVVYLAWCIASYFRGRCDIADKVKKHDTTN